MNRRKARELALQMLFQAEFSTPGKDMSPPEGFWPEGGDKTGVGEFASDLFRGTLNNMDEIDRVIQKAAENWDLGRMAVVDRNILRSAVYEIIFRNDIPSAVTINEALEIAKKYSTQESVAFINGLLDKIAKDRGKA